MATLLLLAAVLFRPPATLLSTVSLSLATLPLGTAVRRWPFALGGFSDIFFREREPGFLIGCLDIEEGVAISIEEDRSHRPGLEGTCAFSTK